VIEMMMRRTAPASTAGADAPRSRRREQRVRRMQALVAGMLLVPGATGCYESHAVRGATPLAGTEISLAITDRGRVGLGPQLGEGVLRLNGRLAQASDSVYLVRVASVEYAGAPTAHWTGEEVKVPRDYVASVAERRLSRKRSWLAAALAVGVIVAISAAISIFGGGTSPDGTIPDNPQGTS
jgi:hypothetical protein